MLDAVLEIDYALFHYVNTTLHNDFLDFVMPILREKTTWIPLYLFIIGWMVYRFKSKALVYTLTLIFTVAIADTVSSKIIKNTVKRVRPCNDINIHSDMILLVHCGGGYSFTSSHATNHFAIAFFLIGTIGVLIKWIKIPLILWATSISFAQVYVGVHYPFDVLSGAILGAIIGYFIAKFYNRKQDTFVLKSGIT